MRGVRSNVLKSQRASSSNDEDLEHEVVERFFEDRAERLGLDRRSIIVTEPLGSIIERERADTLLSVCFKLVTDAFETCYNRK